MVRMYDDRPSTRRIVLTLAAWLVGLLALAALIFGIAWALSPKAPTDPIAAPRSSATAATTASVVPTRSQPSTAATSAPQSTASNPAPKAVKPTPTKPAPAATPSKPLAGKVVAIDAGHQLHGDASLEPIGPGSSTKKPKVATGASGVKTHQPESAVNLAVALKLRDILKSQGATVVMIRTTQNVNISNSRRAKIANNAHANLFIRLHCDGSTDHSLVGLSTLVPGSNSWTNPIRAQSVKAGHYVHNAVIAATGAKNRGVVTRSDLSGFNWSKVPTVLVEMGFLSNAGEDAKLATSSYQLRLASGLANGITGYLKTL
jgi:N-acetylmuramoyl-L-alanine amidase